MQTTSNNGYDEITKPTGQEVNAFTIHKYINLLNRYASFNKKELETAE